MTHLAAAHTAPAVSERSVAPTLLGVPPSAEGSKRGPTTAQRALIVTGATLVAVVAMAASATTLSDLGRAVGWGEVLAWSLPVSVDVLALVAGVAWLAGGAGQALGRVLTLITVGVSVLLNSIGHLVSTMHLEASSYLVIGVSAVPPLAAALAVHLGATVNADRPDALAPRPFDTIEAVPSTRTVMDPGHRSDTPAVRQTKPIRILRAVAPSGTGGPYRTALRPRASRRGPRRPATALALRTNGLASRRSARTSQRTRTGTLPAVVGRGRTATRGPRTRRAKPPPRTTTLIRRSGGPPPARTTWTGTPVLVRNPPTPSSRPGNPQASRQTRHHLRRTTSGQTTPAVRTRRPVPPPRTRAALPTRCRCWTTRQRRTRTRRPQTRRRTPRPRTRPPPLNTGGPGSQRSSPQTRTKKAARAIPPVVRTAPGPPGTTTACPPHTRTPRTMTARSRGK